MRFIPINLKRVAFNMINAINPFSEKNDIGSIFTYLSLNDYIENEW